MNKTGEIHEDMGMIGYDRARERFVFRQFHVEGFVNLRGREQVRREQVHGAGRWG
jgi:hypothetical protein